MKGVFNASVFIGRPLYPADITTTVSVYDAETDQLVPTLWLDRGGVAELANPHPLAEDGVILFYVDPGRYNIVVEKGAMFYREWPDVIISDAATSGTPGIQSVVAGTNVTVDDTDPLNPVVSATTGTDTFFADVGLAQINTVSLTGYSYGKFHYLNSAGDGAGGDVEVVANGTVDNGYIFSDADGNKVRRIKDGLFRISWYVGANGGSINAAFAALVTAAVAAGEKSILMDCPDFSLSDATDCGGLKVIGVGQTMTGGSFANCAGVENIVKNGSNTSYKTVSPQLLDDDSPKVLFRNSSTQYWVLNGKKGYYNQNTFINAVTTNTDSLATTLTDTTTWRFSENRALVAVYVGHWDVDSVSGTWSQQAVQSGEFPELPVFTSGKPIDYRRSGGVSGSWVQFTNVESKDGFLRIAYVARPSSSTAVEITVDGVSVGTYDFTNASAALKIISVPAAKDSVTVRLTQTAGGTVEVIGPNFYELCDWNGQGVNSLWYLRDSNMFQDNLIQVSANDFVVKEADSGIYGFSYHGGETSISDEFLVDGESYSLSAGEFEVGNRLEIISSCTVDWSSVGGTGPLFLNKRTSFGRLGHSVTFNLSGSANVSELYTYMFGAETKLDFVVSPIYRDINTDVTDDSFTYMGRTNRVEMKNGTTGQRYIAEMTVFDGEENKNNGTWIWKRRFSNPYNKLYYGPVMQGKRTVDGLGWVSNYIFLPN